MSTRMLRYRTDIRLAWRGEPVRQYLIYIGKAPLGMPDGISEPDLDYHYQVIDMHQIDCRVFLEQDNPDALILAILCEFRGRPVSDVVNYIVTRLRTLFGENEGGFRNYLNMLETLSENRALKDQIKEAERMLTQVDVTKLPSYEIGLEDGLEQGREQGRELGRVQLLRRMRKNMNEATIAEVTGLPLAEVQRLLAQDPE